MEQKHKITNAIIQVIESQITTNDPPETKQTLERLIAEGFSTKEATKLIGNVVIAEVFDVMAEEKPFDMNRYIAALSRLPELPDTE